MKTLLIISFLLLTSKALLAQLHFDKSKVSQNVIDCVYQIDEITANPDFDSIDSLRARFADLVWMKMPYASDDELIELTSYSNKHVRLQSFDLLLNFRKKKDTALSILSKHTSDTLDLIQQREGCIVFKMNVFQCMLDMTNAAVEGHLLYKKKDFFDGLNQQQWLELKKLMTKKH